VPNGAPEQSSQADGASDENTQNAERHVEDKDKQTEQPEAPTPLQILSEVVVVHEETVNALNPEVDPANLIDITPGSTHILDQDPPHSPSPPPLEPLIPQPAPRPVTRTITGAIPPHNQPNILRKPPPGSPKQPRKQNMSSNFGSAQT
jgi:hypothetical protein